MKKDKAISIEIMLSLVLIVLAVALLNPFMLWMTSGMQMTVLTILVIIFALFAGYVWQEKARDEREAFHRMVAGRLAFLAGIAVLIIGIVVQSLQHRLDVWLVLALSTMVVAKIIGLVHGKVKH